MGLNSNIIALAKFWATLLTCLLIKASLIIAMNSYNLETPIHTIAILIIEASRILNSIHNYFDIWFRADMSEAQQSGEKEG